MKKSIPMTLLVIMIIAISTVIPAVLALPQDAKRVKINGSGCVTATADLMDVSFSSKSSAMTQKEALDESKNLCKKLTENLKNFGEIKETYRYIYGDCCSGVYYVNKEYVLSSEKTDSLNEITDKLTESGIMQINYVSYRLKDGAKEEKEALKLAIENAEDKAKSLGINLDVFSITEKDGCCSYRCSYSSGEKEITVTANVTVTFMKEPAAKNRPIPRVHDDTDSPEKGERVTKEEKTTDGQYQENTDTKPEKDPEQITIPTPPAPEPQKD